MWLQDLLVPRYAGFQKTSIEEKREKNLYSHVEIHAC